MNTPRVNATDLLRAQVVRNLVRLRYEGSKSQIQERMNCQSVECQTGCAYSYRLSEEFDQSLFHLPNAIEYLSRLPNSENDWQNDFEWTARGVTLFVRGWHKYLCDYGLIDNVVRALQSILQKWNRIFEPHESIPRPTMVSSPLKNAV